MIENKYTSYICPSMCCDVFVMWIPEYMELYKSCLFVANFIYADFYCWVIFYKANRFFFMNMGKTVVSTMERGHIFWLNDICQLSYMISYTFVYMVLKVHQENLLLFLLYIIVVLISKILRRKLERICNTVFSLYVIIYEKKFRDNLFILKMRKYFI